MHAAARNAANGRDALYVSRQSEASFNSIRGARCRGLIHRIVQVFVPLDVFTQMGSVVVANCEDVRSDQLALPAPDTLPANADRAHYQPLRG
jgi:hypothetical protein